jgi:hypothetical protein
MTTLFWVGERSNPENDFIPNNESYRDKDRQASCDVVVDPERRNGHWPAGFKPKENPSIWRCHMASLATAMS